MQRTSEVGLCKAAQQAAMVASEPPMQNPVSSMRRGVRPPAPFTNREISGSLHSVPESVLAVR